ncbi:glycosyltransferase family 4 protein [Mangrovicoccus algicola]|uniref:Glycosyltransferase family 4 protein n=1 Tax=Mangrovicoccus algicola TaxID=2771008 RepID=A0A8J6YYQ9_9RHOB|nr:glycosyltransferase family 4 protein [Mangrovicoccus algicola]MBE3640267.1 glycosyltransferase family 4 protein [Mangrovicoccus algicola]
MSRILFVAPRFHTNLFFATRALIGAGHEVAVFVPKREPTEDWTHVTPQVFGPGTPPAAIRRAVRDFAPDLALVRHARPVSPAVLGAARFGRIPLYHYDQRAADRPWPWYKAWEWRLQGLPARRVTPKTGLEGGAPDPLATFLPWPVEAPSGAGRLPRQGPLRVLCVGKLMQPRKNQDKLIAAMQPLLDTGRARLTLVGSRLASAKGAEGAHLDRLEAAAAASGGAITLVPDVPFAEMAAIYAAHDVCVLPARKEPLGSSPIEAMAFGCVPVIARQCGTACYLTQGVDGFVVDAGDVPGLAAILERLAGDDALVARVGAAARRTAEGPLGPQTFVRRVEALLR